jgi:excisionase family DNA binding protein
MIVDHQPTLIQRLNAIEKPVSAPVLAELLGVSAVTIYKLAKRNALPSFRIASSVKFDCRAVARWLAGERLKEVRQ